MCRSMRQEHPKLATKTGYYPGNQQACPERLWAGVVRDSQAESMQPLQLAESRMKWLTFRVVTAGELPTPSTYYSL